MDAACLYNLGMPACYLPKSAVQSESRFFLSLLSVTYFCTLMLEMLLSSFFLSRLSITYYRTLLLEVLFYFPFSYCGWRDRSKNDWKSIKKNARHRILLVKRTDDERIRRSDANKDTGIHNS